jgi:hypothetical protein
MTEELLVYAPGESERKRRENQEKVRRLTIALAEAGEAFRSATAREERANIIVEALRSRRGSMVTEERSRPSEAGMSEEEVEWERSQ